MKKKKNHKSIKMYAFFCVNSNASTTTYLKTKHTMEFVGFLFQIIIRNPLKRAPFCLEYWIWDAMQRKA